MARIFNTYGPRMHPDDGRVVSNFIVQALRGADLTVQGDGTQTRSFCYVDDMVDGLVRLMDSPDAFIGPVNLGTPGEITILELARKVIALTGSKSGIVHRPLPQDDPRQRDPDIALARRELGWEPRTPLDQGLAKTVAYFRGGPSDRIMTTTPPHTRRISVVGLGYVGLPVAVAFGRTARVVGFDVNPQRITELRAGYDRTGEVAAADLAAADILYTDSHRGPRAPPTSTSSPCRRPSTTRTSPT